MKKIYNLLILTFLLFNLNFNLKSMDHWSCDDLQDHFYTPSEDEIAATKAWRKIPLEKRREILAQQARERKINFDKKERKRKINFHLKEAEKPVTITITGGGSAYPNSN